MDHHIEATQTVLLGRMTKDIHRIYVMLAVWLITIPLAFILGFALFLIWWKG